MLTIYNTDKVSNEVTLSDVLYASKPKEGDRKMILSSSQVKKELEHQLAAVKFITWIFLMLLSLEINYFLL